MRHYRTSLERLREIPREGWASRGLMDEGLFGVVAKSLRLVAQMAADSSTGRAAPLLGAAATQAAAPFPLLRAERSRVDRVEDAVRQRLREEDFARAWAVGDALSGGDALDEALHLTVDTVT